MKRKLIGYTISASPIVATIIYFTIYAARAIGWIEVARMMGIVIIALVAGIGAVAIMVTGLIIAKDN